MSNVLASLIKEANTTLITKGRLQDIEKFFAPDYKVHITGRQITGGHKIVVDILSELRRSFGDAHIDVEVFLENTDRIAWQRTWHGTHIEKYKGFPASGLNIVWRDMLTSQFRDGLIIEEWVVTDLAEQLLLSKKRGA